MLLINSFQSVWIRFESVSNPYILPQITSYFTSNIHPILGCDIILHPKYPIWVVDGVLNPYLRILHFFQQILSNLE